MKKRFIAVLLLAVMLLCSCGVTSDTASDTTPAATSADETTVPDIPAEKEKIKVIADGKTDFLVTRNEDANGVMVKLAIQFRDELKKRTSAEFTLKSDFIMRGQTEDKTVKEIIVGDCDRDSSRKLAEDITAVGGSRFGILTDGNKIAVTGTDEYLVYFGLSYLMDNFIKKDGDAVTFEIEDGYEYVSEEINVDAETDFAEAEKKGIKLAFYVMDKVVSVPTSGSHSVMQGGGTDGTYAYYAVIDKNALTSIIYKYDMATWKIVAKSSPLPTAHTNDITYDAVNKRLVISYCHESDGYLGMCFVDAETLEYQGYIKTPVAQRAVEYLPATNQYLLGTNYYYTLCDADFNKISSFNDGWPNYTTQGMCCDDKYVYDVRWISSKPEQQYIIVHGLDGTCYGEISFTGMSGEPENMFRLGNEYYIGCNKSMNVYRVKLLLLNWW